LNEKAAARATLKQDKERLLTVSKQLKNADAHFGALGGNERCSPVLGAASFAFQGF
jgi:hypothetical protein